MASDDTIFGLAATAGRVLFKSSVGEEDWTEWIDLRDSLEATMPKLDPVGGVDWGNLKSEQAYVRAYLDDFDARLKARFPDFAEQVKQERKQEREQEREEDENGR